MAIGDLNVRIGATIQGLQQGLKTAERELNRFANKTNALGNSLTLGVSLPLAGLGAAAVKAFADFESLELGLTAITGSAEEAGKQLDRLRKIALQPSVNLEQAVKASVQLQTVGFNAEEAENAISQFAKAATLSGAGADGLAAVVKQITQINSKGRILQEDIGIILENVPSVGLAIKDAFGTTSVDAIRASGVSAREFTDQLIKAIENSEQFQAAQGGLSTQIENFGIALKESLVTLGRTISTSINLGDTLTKLSGFVNGVVTSFSKLSPELQKSIVQIGLLVLAVGPALKGISLLVSGFGALLNPINLVIIGIVALASAFILAYNNSEKFRGALFGLAAGASEIFKIFGEAAKALVQGFSRLNSGDLTGAVKSFGEFIKKGNPIGIALTEGERLAKAYADGVAKGVQAQKLPTVQQLIQNVSGGATGKPTASLAPVGGTVDTTKLEEAVKTTALEPLSIEIPVIASLAPNEELLARFGESAGAVTRQTEAFKKVLEDLPASTNLVDQSLGGLLERLNDGFDESISGIRGEVQALDSAMSSIGNTITESARKTSEATAIVGEAGVQITQSINAAISDGFEQFGTALGEFAAGVGKVGAFGYTILNALLNLIKQVGTILIQAGIGLLAIKKAFESLNPYVAIAAGVALVALSAAVRASLQKKANSIQAFAEGGIVTAPTLGLVGEAGPEAIIPLRKFDQVVGGMQSGELVARVSGDDLYLIYQRAAQRKGRIG